MGQLESHSTFSSTATAATCALSEPVTAEARDRAAFAEAERAKADHAAADGPEAKLAAERAIEEVRRYAALAIANCREDAREAERAAERATIAHSAAERAAAIARSAAERANKEDSCSEERAWEAFCLKERAEKARKLAQARVVDAEKRADSAILHAKQLANDRETSAPVRASVPLSTRAADAKLRAARADADAAPNILARMKCVAAERQADDAKLFAELADAAFVDAKARYATASKHAAEARAEADAAPNIRALIKRGAAERQAADAKHYAERADADCVAAKARHAAASKHAAEARAKYDHASAAMKIATAPVARVESKSSSKE